MESQVLSNIIECLIEDSNAITLSESLWLAAIHIHAIDRSYSVEYLHKCIPTCQFDQLSWFDEIRPDWLDTVIKYFIFKHQKIDHWTAISVGSILIHVALDASDHIKLNGTYFSCICCKLKNTIELLVHELANTYVRYANIPDECLSLVLEFFSHLINTFHKSQGQSAQLISWILNECLDSMYDLVRSQNLSESDDKCLHFKLSVDLFHKVLNTSSSHDYVIGDEMLNIYLTKLESIILLCDTALRRDLISRLMGSILTVVFMRLEAPAERSDVSSACAIESKNHAETTHVFTNNQITTIHRYVTLSNKLGHTTTSSGDEEDIGSAVLILCLLFSVPEAITHSLANTSNNKLKSNKKASSQSKSSNSSSAAVFMSLELSMFRQVSLSESDQSEQQSESLRSCRHMWSLIQKGLLHPSDVLLRKRCVFILQCMHRNYVTATAATTAGGTTATATTGIHGDEDVAIEQWRLLIDIFVNIEGSNSAHLVTQLMPAMQRLFNLVATTTPSSNCTQGFDLRKGHALPPAVTAPPAVVAASLPPLVFNTSLNTWLPEMSFDWTRSLLHCMLNLSMPIIRRIGLYQLLSGQLTLQVNASFIQWFCEELLGKLIDDISYYSAYYLDASVDLGCEAAIAESVLFKHNSQSNTNDNSDGEMLMTICGKNSSGSFSSIPSRLSTEMINPETYPGILLPYFMSTMIARCSEQTSLLSDLIRSIFRVVCSDTGIQSPSAIKWIFRPFAESCVLSLLSRCLLVEDLHALKLFIRGRLHNSNSFVKNQIMSSVLPLVLTCVDISSDDHNTTLLIELMDLLVNDFTLVRMMQPTTLPLLKHTIALAAPVVTDYAMLSESAIKHLAIMTSLSELHQSHGCLSVMCDSMLNDVASLFSCIYMPLPRVRRALSYLHGFLLSLKCAYSYDAKDHQQQYHHQQQQEKQQLQQKLVVPNSTAVGHCIPTLKVGFLVDHITDLSSYMLTILQAALRRSVNNNTAAAASTGFTVSDIISDIHTLEMCFEILNGLIFVIKISETNDNNNYSTADRKLIVLNAKLALCDCLCDLCLLISEEIATPAADCSLSVYLCAAAILTRELHSDLVNQSSSSSSQSSSLKKTLIKLYNSLVVSCSHNDSQHAFNSFLLNQQTQSLSLADHMSMTNMSMTAVDSYKERSRHTSNSLLFDLMSNVCRGQFSRYSDFCLSNRWAGVSSIIKLFSTTGGCNGIDISFRSIPRGICNDNDDNNDNDCTRVVPAKQKLLPITHDADDMVSTLNIDSLLDQLGMSSAGSITAILICCKQALHTRIMSEVSLSLLEPLTEYTPGNALLPAAEKSLQAVPSAADRRAETLLDDVQLLLDHSYRMSVVNVDQLDATAANAFIDIAFDEALLVHVGASVVQVYFDKLLEMARISRPYIAVSITYQLSIVICRHPKLLLYEPDSPFYIIGVILSLLIYKEPRLDDTNCSNITHKSDNKHTIQGTNNSSNNNNNSSNSSSSATGGSDFVEETSFKFNASRLMLLTALEQVMRRAASNKDSSNDESETSNNVGIQNIVKSLINMNMLPRYRAAAMIGSDLFGEKLRSWQALCVLSPSLTQDQVEATLDNYINILNDNVVYAIRVPMEIFGAALGRCHPYFVLHRLTAELKEVNHSQQKLASMFIILGHLFIDNKACDILTTTESTTTTVMGNMAVTAAAAAAVEVSSSGYRSDYKLQTEICYLLMSWMSCSQGLPRGIAQVVFHALYTNLRNQGHEDNILKNVFHYLDTNKDSMKSLQRQRDFFEEYSLEARSSVAGLASLAKTDANNINEIVPPHLLTILESFLKSTYDMSILDVHNSHSAYQITTTDTDTDGASTNNRNTNQAIYSTVQTKRIPFSEIQLTVHEYVSSRKLNEQGIVKQSLVVCATLVEKTVNLAGIARTSEIFAVEELVIANMIVTKSEAFQGIAVSSDNWLKISEVPEIGLLGWVRSMKVKGYVIVALEQSDASKSLADSNVTLPVKCVLLLGKEKEGVPVHLLNEVDLCIEIPQLGVTRSLNVSAALFIWEATRRNPHLAINQQQH